MRFTHVERLGFSDYIRPDRTDLDESTRSVRSNEEFRRRYFAFTSLEYDPGRGRVYCGMTHFAGDLLYEFDPGGGSFRSLGYASIADGHEIKIHRGLWLGGDGCLYSATSTLSGLDELAEAPGGKVFRYDPDAGRYDLLGVPCPHLYIQTVSLSGDGRTVCGMAYPAFEFFALDVPSGEVRYRRFVGSIVHVGAFDDAGGYWGTWLNKGDHCLFRYDPSENRVTFLPNGFATPCRGLMYRGAGPIDSMVNGNDGFLYVGHESGELYRIDPAAGRAEYLAKPLPGHRMPGLTVGPDDLLIGVGGNDGAVMGFTWDRRTARCEVLGEVRADDGEGCFRPHDCCLVGEALYVGETDNPRRSCYLWKCVLG